MKQSEYNFLSRLWLTPGEAGWHFITLPTEVAQDIDFYFSTAKKGWGSLPVIVTIEKTEWKTSVFPDKKTRSYLLPIKSEIRKKENLRAGDTITLRIKILE
jgi:hypothetical protein